MAPREALRMVAEQIADIVTEPMPKGEVSTALTQRVPEEMTVDCRRCKATHIVETLFRSAVLPAGIVFDPNEPIVTFVPIPDWPGVPDEADGVEDLVGAYLYLHGPARARDAATFLGTRAGELTPWWPTDLVEVGYAGRTGWLPADAQALFVDPPDPPRVRLLPPSDPFLQARDRDFVVPEAEHRERLWPILGRPGALLVDGEVAGLWRARKRGRRLEMNVEPFRRLTAAVKRALEDEAQLVATARGTRSAEVTVDTP